MGDQHRVVSAARVSARSVGLAGLFGPLLIMYLVVAGVVLLTPTVAAGIWLTALTGDVLPPVPTVVVFAIVVGGVVVTGLLRLACNVLRTLGVNDPVVAVLAGTTVTTSLVVVPAVIWSETLGAQAPSWRLVAMLFAAATAAFAFAARWAHRPRVVTAAAAVADVVVVATMLLPALSGA